jgi:hypothetical protein
MNNFDNNIKNSLSDFEYDFAPEYWDAMEQKLNESTSNNTGSVTKFGGKAGLGSWANLFIYTSIVSLVITAGLVGYNQFSEDEADTTNIAINTMEQDCGDEDFVFLPVDKHPQQEENNTMLAEEANVQSRPQKTVKTVNDDVNLMVDLHIAENRIESQIQTEASIELAAAEDSNSYSGIGKEEYEIPDPQYISDDNKQDTVSTPTMKVHSKTEKEKKPMRKPKKRIFGKKGILYLLGIRK